MSLEKSKENTEFLLFVFFLINFQLFDLRSEMSNSPEQQNMLSYNNDTAAIYKQSKISDGTNLLAYRDIPSILEKYVRGKRAIDYGCGTGRSTRFLEELGYEVVGVDISQEMLKQALSIVKPIIS